jgi:hypothetical protein
MNEPDQAVRLAEFAVLRDEMGHRAGSQQALMALNLTLVATIVGFVVTKKADDELLLVVPIVSPALGIRWLDHDRYIHLAAGYIRNCLWDKFDVTDPSTSWESYLSEEGTPKLWQVISWGSTFLLFLAVSLAALFLAFPTQADSASPGLWILWGFGCMLSVAYGTAFANAIATWRRFYREGQEEVEPATAPEGSG